MRLASPAAFVASRLRSFTLAFKVCPVKTADLRAFNDVASKARIVNLIAPSATSLSTRQRLVIKMCLFVFVFLLFTHIASGEITLRVPGYKTRAAMSRLCNERPASQIRRENALFVRCQDLDLYWQLLWLGNTREALRLMQPSVDADTEATTNTAE